MQLAASDTNTSSKCWPVTRRKSSPNIVASTPRPDSAGRQRARWSRSSQPPARMTLPSSSDRGIHCNHAGRRNFVGERGQCRPGLGQPLRQIRAVQQHGRIGREKISVVGEHAQAVAVDLGIRRIYVGDGGCAPPSTPRRQGRESSPARHQLQPVRALQRQPAVLAIQKLLRQARTQDRDAARDQGDAYAAFFCASAIAHCQRIGIAEPQRDGRYEPVGARWRLMSLIELRRTAAAEQFERDGP